MNKSRRKPRWRKRIAEARRRSCRRFTLPNARGKSKKARRESGGAGPDEASYPVSARINPRTRVCIESERGLGNELEAKRPHFRAVAGFSIWVRRLLKSWIAQRQKWWITGRERSAFPHWAPKRASEGVSHHFRLAPEGLPRNLSRPGAPATRATPVFQHSLSLCCRRLVAHLVVFLEPIEKRGRCRIKPKWL